MDIIKLARDLGSEIQKQDVYLNLVKSQAENDDDQELQQLIGEFNLKRMILNAETSKDKEKKDQSKVETLDKEIKELYDKIMSNPNMIKYNTSRQALTKLLTDINKILSAAVTGQDPQTIDLEDHSCGGSCSTCGGCH